MDTKNIAMICHEANRAYCASIGDHSQLPWDEAPAWQRDSAIAGVESAILHPEATPEQQHDSWSEAKLNDGWKYGPVKDEARREHPCLVPYGQLPEEQRRKDALFLAIVRALA